MEATLERHVAVDVDICVGCGACVAVCPCDVLALQGGLAVVVDADACIECESCVDACPIEAITL